MGSNDDAVIEVMARTIGLRHRVARSPTVSEHIVEHLRALGVRRAFGLLGGAGLPFFEACRAGGLEPVQFRHEAGAVFAALEHELAGGGGAVVFTTTGPGLVNALNAVEAARRDGGRVLLVSAATGPGRRGSNAFQETSAQALPHRGLLESGAWFHFATAVESPDELPRALSRIAEGWQRPGGFVAHLSLPLSVQRAHASTPQRGVGLVSTVAPAPAAVETVAEMLRGSRSALWLGFGARQASGRIRELVDRLDAVVFSTPRGKGIFPEHDPRFVGVSGFGGREDLGAVLRHAAPAVTMVLGTSMGEMSSFWADDLLRGDTLVHVDVDRSAFGAAFPHRPFFAVESEIGGFVDALLDRLPAAPVRQRRTPVPCPPARGLRREEGVRPSVLMQLVQSLIVDRSDAVVLAEAGNAFVWAVQSLRFDDPGRFRTSMAWGSMGHATAGVVGVAMARRAPAVALVGDGSMLMSNEVHTAVATGTPAVWIVLNDARYGLVADGMQGLGYGADGLAFPKVDFVALAGAVGALGLRVTSECELSEALVRALACGGPCVVDVWMDPSERAPVGARNASLAQQGGTADV